MEPRNSIRESEREAAELSKIRRRRGLSFGELLNGATAPLFPFVLRRTKHSEATRSTPEGEIKWRKTENRANGEMRKGLKREISFQLRGGTTF
ncbi:hypothetical protein CDL15_Pgr016995 [Punica granatum]|uniref:Uncharacterized protein n=1 Tax=Punica granatum TaxID=22663 RepID=A0A218WXS5_PUNGR|nr:hypothetical protein CDL15_Pgr016995 [Punica granatum]